MCARPPAPGCPHRLQGHAEAALGLRDADAADGLVERPIEVGGKGARRSRAPQAEDANAHAVEGTVPGVACRSRGRAARNNKGECEGRAEGLASSTHTMRAET